MVGSRDFVVVALSQAWKEHWQGINAAHVGAGAGVEADTVKGIFGRDQTIFRRKTLLALLPGVPHDVISEELFRLNLTGFTSQI